jgi:hypothetical protein
MLLPTQTNACNASTDSKTQQTYGNVYRVRPTERTNKEQRVFAAASLLPPPPARQGSRSGSSDMSQTAQPSPERRQYLDYGLPLYYTLHAISKDISWPT